MNSILKKEELSITKLKFQQVEIKTKKGNSFKKKRFEHRFNIKLKSQEDLILGSVFYDRSKNIFIAIDKNILINRDVNIEYFDNESDLALFGSPYVGV